MLAVLVASERDTSTKSLEKLLPKGHDVVQGKNGLPSVHKSIVEDMVGTIHGPKAKTCVA